jgi:KaiC/GvpD/RAD55 family RecA-like ATPase
MSVQDKVSIRKLPTGVPGLDEILGGGLPEFSFNIIAGAPGGGSQRDTFTVATRCSGGSSLGRP